LALWAGYVSLTRPEVEPTTPLIAFAALAATGLFYHRYRVARIALPLVWREWQRLGPDNLRKFIASAEKKP
jgi:hypothetical protein